MFRKDFFLSIIKYIGLLETFEQKGMIRMSALALMKDRVLMNKGEPQIYGSQILNGSLYDLYEPKYVNRRRAEVGLGPIEQYLKRFNIVFEVLQE